MLSSCNNTRGVTPPSVIVSPSPAGHPFMILVCDLIFCVHIFQYIVSCGKLPLNNSEIVTNVVTTSESLVVTSN